MKRTSQDLHDFLEWYGEAHGDDVVRVTARVSADQDVTAMVWELARQGRDELLWFDDVDGREGPLVTNVFASRQRIERILGAPAGRLHESYQAKAKNRLPLTVVETGPATEKVTEGDAVDLHHLPLLRHFDSDAAPYITSGIIVAEHPDTGVGNLSYHRAMVHSRVELATSLHSRGDLWRLLRIAEQRATLLPVAMVIGGHPLFMLAASARVPESVDEREIAGGLFGAPLETIRTPTYGIRVPASADFVLEGVLDPAADVKEGPFGEFSGYSSDRSTNDLIKVTAVLQRARPVWVDVVGGNSAEHLNLARVPREAEMAEKLKERFPSVTAVHYPNSGTHFHCYVAVRQRRPGEPRQVMLGLLGWDPYLKTVVAVDEDVDVTDDASVLWALATHFQPARDLFVVDGLPGSPLDPSSSVAGETSRMGLDATRGSDFSSIPIRISDEACARARHALEQVTTGGDKA